MRISDWSSDVCSSDLLDTIYFLDTGARQRHHQPAACVRCGMRSGKLLGCGAEARACAVGHQPRGQGAGKRVRCRTVRAQHAQGAAQRRSEEHTSELQSLMRISYAVFCWKQKTKTQSNTNT